MGTSKAMRKRQRENRRIRALLKRSENKVISSVYNSEFKLTKRLPGSFEGNSR